MQSNSNLSSANYTIFFNNFNITLETDLNIMILKILEILLFTIPWHGLMSKYQMNKISATKTSTTKIKFCRHYSVKGNTEALSST